VKAEDLSSTDEEEEVRPLSVTIRTCLFKFSTQKKFEKFFAEFLFYG